MRFCRFLFVVLSLSLISCGYAGKVKNISDKKLCKNLGTYTYKDHADGINITMNEIDTRKIDAAHCENMANARIDKLRAKRKLHLCQVIATFQYAGEYKHYKKAMKEIEERGFADEECETMAKFQMARLDRRKEKSDRLTVIGAALIQASANMRGSTLNPIHVKIQ